jgi:hypothetical protein
MKNDHIFGSLMIATWCNSVLFMLESIQVYQCLWGPKRSRSIKCLVLCCYAIDVICTVADCACVYLYTITHWGDEEYGMKQHWPMPVEHISTGAVGFIVQLFLLLRYYSLSRNLWVSTLIGLISFVSAAAAIIGSSLMMVYSSYSERGILTAPTLVWLVAATVADWAIAGGLVWELTKRKSRVGLRSTDGIIRELISNAIKTGAVTSFFATVDMINWVAETESNAAVAIGFCLGRIYALTMLYNINNRGGLSKFRLDSESSSPKEGQESNPQCKNNGESSPVAGVFTTTGMNARTSIMIDHHHISSGDLLGSFTSTRSDPSHGSNDLAHDSNVDSSNRMSRDL